MVLSWKCSLRKWRDEMQYVALPHFVTITPTPLKDRTKQSWRSFRQGSALTTSYRKTGPRIPGHHTMHLWEYKGMSKIACGSQCPIHSYSVYWRTTLCESAFCSWTKHHWIVFKMLMKWNTNSTLPTLSDVSHGFLHLNFGGGKVYVLLTND